MPVKTIATSTLITLAVMFTTPIGAAYARNGDHGGGSGGGHDSDGGNRGGDHSDRGKSNSGHSKADARDKDHTRERKVHAVRTTERVEKAEKMEAAEQAKLRSLNRNYHAYLNSNDPRFADVFAYARAYAEYELKYGTDALPSDPALSDEALRDALASATETSTVSDATLDRAKHILGVGDDVGKIDQIRQTLATSETETEND